MRLSVPPGRLCVDNAAMIAWAALERWNAGDVDGDAYTTDVADVWPIHRSGDLLGDYARERAAAAASNPSPSVDPARAPLAAFRRR